ncbi:MAG: sodium/proton-translocating pyrophosphatase, partial [Candidatus Hydrogenedentes bacterium]|nr:sodium/proton-translocating pyrophosphatase [Candidatus Hydrogenedentota bacterium]
MEVPFLKLAVVASGIALAFVVYLVRYVLAQPQGSDHMADLSRMIQEGAVTFLRREYIYVVSVSAVVVAFLVGIGVYNPDLGLNWKTAVAFMAGAVASACAGFLGMYIATRAN